jgi:biopolymer transport protein ExbB/TolQ
LSGLSVDVAWVTVNLGRWNPPLKGRLSAKLAGRINIQKSGLSMSNHEHDQEMEATFEADTNVQSIAGGRPSTDANVFFQLIFGAVATVVLAVAVGLFKGSDIGGLRYIYEIINERGWVQYGELLMSFMVVALMVLKSRIVKNQLSVVASNPIPVDIDMSNDQQLLQLRDSLMRREEFSWSIILNRIDRAINLWLSTKDVSRVTTWAGSESTRDTASSDSSYSLCRVLIWAIPILGFIGTVLGLALAVSGFGVLGGSAEISAIKDAIGQVTVGLGVAFDTTLLALFLTVLLMFPLSFIQRSEENLFVELENYLDDMFLSRLPSGDKQSIVIENLEDSIEAAFRRYIPDPDRYDEVFTRSIEKAAASVEAKFANLSKNYETALKEVSGQLTGSLNGVGDNFRKSVAGALEDLHKQDTALMASRKQWIDEEKKHMAAALDGVAKSAESVVAGYQKTAHELQAASSAAAAKSADAAHAVAVKLDEVTKLAAGIQDLLKLEKAVEKSLSSMAASDDFRKTLEDLRKHINSTTEFCNRLSKPRVITLREELT